MDETARLAASAQGAAAAKSKRTQSASGREKSRNSKPLPSTPTSPRSSSSRASLAGTRTSSAPLVPLLEAKPLPINKDADSHATRDSVSSIKDDPFFRHYQTPNSVSLARELRSAIYEERQGKGEAPKLSPSRGGSSTDGSVKMPLHSRKGMADINIAVIGSTGVGKSTLIKRALGIRGLPTAIASSLRMSVENVVYTVSLIELDLESFDIAPDHRIHWPKQINGHIVPRIDGALLLYDVMNRDSITELPQTLNALVNTSLPTILVSCKCDVPENSRQIDVESMEAACPSCVKAVKTAENVPESSRLCLSTMLRAIMASRNSKPIEPTPAPRRRAISSAHLEKPPASKDARPSSQHSPKHSRASSEYSITKVFPPQPAGQSSSRSGGPPLSRNNGRANLHHQFTLPDPHDAPPLSAHPAFKTEDPKGLLKKNPVRSPSPRPTSLGKAIDSTFLDMEESDADSVSRYSDDIPILQRNDDNFFDKPAKVAGVTFKELVDRLLDQNMSRSDNNFSEIFLCLYRKFAAPSELFKAILDRLQEIADDKNMHYLTRTTDQLRIITVIAKWVSSYPGDFASPTTSANLEQFITQLSSDPVFGAAALDMRMQLISRVVEDDDTGWARSDADVEIESGNTTNAVPTPAPGRQRSNSRDLLEETQKLLLDGDASESKNLIERKQSITDSGSSARPQSSSQSLAPSFHTVEDYEREAATMVPKSVYTFSKFLFHRFMEVPDDDLAEEMTRIDWVMFSSIRLRDLVRDVSLSLEQKDKCKSLTNVNRMTSHFNHIAKWVSNLILYRDKAKHRALMLEKLMTIAVKLRELNNYNGLAAVLAGINGSAIHRLAHTRAAVPADVQKRFARLVLLMGTQKSHFAYRLAWENSSLPRIPFIPLHRRDLVSAELGSRTYLGEGHERINWKKFEVLSEVILPIMKSQVTPYPNLAKDESARELILDCKMATDDEDIYQRSLEVESSSGTTDFGKEEIPLVPKGEVVACLPLIL